MSRKKETRDCGGVEVHVTQLSAMKAYRLLPMLGKVMLPLLDGMAGLSLQSDATKMIVAVRAALESMDENQFTDLTLKLFGPCYAITDGKKVDLGTEDGVNRAFDGKLGGLMMAVMFALEVNYKDFLTEGLGLITGEEESPDPAPSQESQTQPNPQ